MTRELVRFASPRDVAGWGAIDDRVMGGASQSRLRHDPAGYAVFEGVVSFAGNGGFASVRSGPGDFAVPGARALLVDVLGDGRRYKLALRTDDAFDGISHQAAFEPPVGAWTVLRMPVSGFRATFRGRDVAGAPALDPARVRQIGLMIADRQSGPFALAVRSIAAE